MNGIKSTTLREVIERVLSNSRHIEGFPHYYISRSAMVYKYKSGKLRKINYFKTTRGYFQVSLKDESGYKTRYVHVIFKKTFPDVEVPKHLLAQVVEAIKPNKLQPNQVKEILERRASGEGLRCIAKDYNVSHTQIRRICEKDNWKNV